VPPRSRANGISESVSIASSPPAAKAAARSPFSPHASVATNPRPEATPHASTTTPHMRAILPARQPEVARSAEGASAWGTFDTNTAMRNDVLIDCPDATWMPKIKDSGIPSTTAPTTIPSAPEPPPSSNFDSTSASLTMNTPPPTNSHSASCPYSSPSPWGMRSKAIAAIRAPAPNPAKAPTTFCGTFTR